jgi:hypothetical protein
MHLQHKHPTLFQEQDMKQTVIYIGIICILLMLIIRISHSAPVSAAPSDTLLIVADQPDPLVPLIAFLEQKGPFTIRTIDQIDLPDDLSKYKAVFMYIHGPMTPKTERALIDYTLNGGRLIILHHGIASARVNNPAWLDMTGITILPRSHPDRPWRVIPDTTYTIVNLNPDHYITSHNVTWPRTVEYTSSDSPSVPAAFGAIDLTHTEVFLNQHFSDGRQKTVLLGFRCIDPETNTACMQDRAAWYKPAAKGYVFYFQPGHSVTDFRNADYCQMILNSLNYQPPQR